MKKIIFTITLLAGFFVPFVFAKEAFAAILTLDPSTKSTQAGTEFQVEMRIDTQGENTTSTDAVLTYDPNILSVVDVTAGGIAEEPFYPDFFLNISSGEIYIGASVIDPIEIRNGEGAVATITFSADADGTSDVVFDCTPGKTSDTNISKSDKNATDIVNCDGLVNGRYTVGTGVGSPPSVTPTGVVYATATPTPTLPSPGGGTFTMGIIGFGFVLTLLALGTRLIVKV